MNSFTSEEIKAIANKYKDFFYIDGKPKISPLLFRDFDLKEEQDFLVASSLASVNGQPILVVKIPSDPDGKTSYRTLERNSEETWKERASQFFPLGSIYGDICALFADKIDMPRFDDMSISIDWTKLFLEFQNHDCLANYPCDLFWYDREYAARLSSESTMVIAARENGTHDLDNYPNSGFAALTDSVIDQIKSVAFLQNGEFTVRDLRNMDFDEKKEKLLEYSHEASYKRIPVMLTDKAALDPDNGALSTVIESANFMAVIKKAREEEIPKYFRIEEHGHLGLSDGHVLVAEAESHIPSGAKYKTTVFRNEKGKWNVGKKKFDDGFCFSNLFFIYSNPCDNPFENRKEFLGMAKILASEYGNWLDKQARSFEIFDKKNGNSVFKSELFYIKEKEIANIAKDELDWAESNRQEQKVETGFKP